MDLLIGGVGCSGLFTLVFYVKEMSEVKQVTAGQYMVGAAFLVIRGRSSPARSATCTIR